MARFVYKIRDNRGLMGSGVLNASDLAEASRLLRSEGNVIVNLREQSVAAESAGNVRTGKTRAKHEEVLFFANQLSVMVDTGVPLPEALDCIAEQINTPGFRSVVADLAEQVKGGVDFSSALGRYPRVFNRLFVAMIRASEVSGMMGKMLQRIAQHLQRQQEIRRQVKGAATYPLAMLCFCVLVVVAMLIFILPRFEKIYAGKSAALPAPTKLLLAMSGGLINHWMYIIIGIAAVVTACYLYFRRPEGKVVLDRIRINLPVLGSMFRRSAMARALRTLSTMIDAGVTMLEALTITADVSGNIIFSRIWTVMGERIKEGASLSDEMLKQPLIPRSVTQMVTAGEKTGRLGLVLDRLAGFCEHDLETSIKTVTSFIEPVMIVVMGGIVGGIAMALLLPIFSLSKVVAGG